MLSLLWHVTAVVPVPQIMAQRWQSMVNKYILGCKTQFTTVNPVITTVHRPCTDLTLDSCAAVRSATNGTTAPNTINPATTGEAPTNTNNSTTHACHVKGIPTPLNDGPKCTAMPSPTMHRPAMVPTPCHFSTCSPNAISKYVRVLRQTLRVIPHYTQMYGCAYSSKCFQSTVDFPTYKQPNLMLFVVLTTAVLLNSNATLFTHAAMLTLFGPSMLEHGHASASTSLECL
ncbi:hypothetical protein THRCLA_22814 [Thraustotheca clavata]|uniref:Secreted protein n=1 Tax=Thraustotheca clavata TaxID=74557 RepID=A0A1V9YS87_9STRA|nr:hypothetical protein THRCLA_22814 [Thraustotheca clavata]